MKRIAITHSQFVQSGMPTALHVNGRTDRDFDRWAAFVADRQEVNALAYEFGTGAGRVDRLALHASWLIRLAKAVDRPLHLLVRGGVDVLPRLANAFSSVTLIETSTFMKTQKRQRAFAAGNATWRWEPSPTEAGAPLDKLLLHNVQVVGEAVSLLTTRSETWPIAPAA